MTIREKPGRLGLWGITSPGRRNRLGSAKEDTDAVPYAILRQKLLAVYERKSESDVRDPALNQLLKTRAILHFNGDYWYGVHPLVVDIMKEQGHLLEDAPGGVS